MSSTNPLPAWSKWSGSRPVDAVSDLIGDLDHVPTSTEYAELSRGVEDLPGLDVLLRAHGGYRETLRLAGIDPLEVFGSLDEALELAEELGEDPTELLEGGPR